jgi:hypothetical protein
MPRAGARRSVIDNARTPDTRTRRADENEERRQTMRTKRRRTNDDDERPFDSRRTMRRSLRASDATIEAMRTT